jgi:hypothetical protein
MVFWFGNPLWKLLEGPLKGILKDKFSVLNKRFKGLLSSTENDLIAVVKDRFSSTMVNFHFARAAIGNRGDGSPITFYLLPVAALSESSKIKDALAKRLKDNVDLGAARNTAGIEDDAWDQMIQDYSADVLRLGLPFAIKRIVDDETEFSLGYYLIDLAKGEAIKISQKDVNADLIVLYKPPPRVSNAKKLWEKRNDKAYEYKRDKDGYDGFKAT